MAVSANALAEVCGPDILGRVARFLPPNEVACTLRLVSRSIAQQFGEHNIVRFSQPSPAAAFAAYWSAPGACRVLSSKRRRQLLCLTAASGDTANLEMALAATGLCPTADVMAAAAAAGQLQMCRWLAERGCPLEGPYSDKSPLAAAAKGGHAAICEWLLEQGCDWRSECAQSAALGGHPGLMRALLRKAPPGLRNSRAYLMKGVAEGCDLGTLQELWREWGGGSDPGMLSAGPAAAARSPSPDWAAKVAWLLEQQGAERSPTVCAAAASCPDALARLTLLVEGMGLPVDATAFDAAACNSRVDAVCWLLAQGFRSSPTLKCRIACAPSRGHTEVLRVLHAAGCPLPRPKVLAANACQSGSVETVSWVVDTFGAEALNAAGPKAFNAALSCGSLELVTWLRERGLGPNPDSWTSAAVGGCVAVLELLADVQAPSCLPDERYLTAAGRGDLLTLEALRRLGLPLSRTQLERKALVGKAIRRTSTPLPALRWLRQAAGEVDWAAALEGARGWQRFAVMPGWRAGLGEEVVAWVQAEAAAAAQAEGRK